MPALRVEVREPLYGKRKTYAVPLDTGYAGYVMVPDSDYDELAAMEVAREGFGTYVTLAPSCDEAGEGASRLYGQEFESMIETPLHGGGKLLLGRRILNALDMALLGESGKACVVRAEQERKHETATVRPLVPNRRRELFHMT